MPVGLHPAPVHERIGAGVVGLDLGHVLRLWDHPDGDLDRRLSAQAGGGVHGVLLTGGLANVADPQTAGGTGLQLASKAAAAREVTVTTSRRALTIASIPAPR